MTFIWKRFKITCKDWERISTHDLLNGVKPIWKLKKKPVSPS